MVREFDSFEYQHGLDSRPVHKPGGGARGEIIHVHSLSKLSNGNYGFEVNNKTEMDTFAARCFKSFGSKYSPWTEDYGSMAKKTVIKGVLKYVPISPDLQKTLLIDEAVRTEITMDMSEIRSECPPEEARSEAV